MTENWSRQRVSVKSPGKVLQKVFDLMNLVNAVNCKTGNGWGSVPGAVNYGNTDVLDGHPKS